MLTQQSQQSQQSQIENRTDIELITETINGNLSSFDILISRHDKCVHRMISRYVYSEMDIEDVAAQVWTLAYRKLHQFQHSSSFNTWICAIAIRKAIDYKRKLVIEQSKNDSLQDLSMNAHFDIPDLAINSNPEIALLRQDKKLILKEAIDNLPYDFKMVVNLFHFSDLTYEQIEDVLHIPAGTVKSRLARARDRLRDQLESYINL